MCTQQEAEALGFDSPEAAAAHAQASAHRANAHELARRYQQTRECQQRRAEAALAHGIGTDQIVWVVPAG